MRKGYVKSEEWLRKISEANKGKPSPRKGMIFVPIEEQRSKRAAYKKAWNKRNHDRQLELARIRAAKNREKLNARARERYHVKRDEELSRHRLKKYGMDKDTYDAMVQAQGGRCIICNDETDINLSVDHNHSTGKIRGLICNSCNIAIAKAKDSPVILRAMADYLEKFDD